MFEKTENKQKEAWTNSTRKIDTRQGTPSILTIPVWIPLMQKLHAKSCPYKK